MSFDTLDYLRTRADIFQRTRAFFAERDVLEVHTPLLRADIAPERYIEPIATEAPHRNLPVHWLHTSPEAAMKRLLANGSGAIYQLCPVFRREEHGLWHRHEFYMLEWYRPEWDERKLQREVQELIVVLLGIKHAREIRYKDLWHEALGINPHEADVQAFKECAAQHHISMSAACVTRTDCVQYLFAHAVEPLLKKEEVIFVWDYPIDESPQSAEYKDEQGCSVARRFELYVRGVELANGNRELIDPDVLLRRLNAINTRVPLDVGLIDALRTKGFPDCSGVALGMDRLVALAMDLSALPNAHEHDT